MTTSLKTSTADLGLAAFPKIVICNKYQLRYISLIVNFSEKKPSRQSLLEAVGMCVKNSSLSEMSFAINKILLTGFDKEVILISGQVGMEMKFFDKVPLDVNHQDPVAKVLEEFDLFSFLSPTAAPIEMKEYW